MNEWMNEWIYVWNVWEPVGKFKELREVVGRSQMMKDLINGIIWILNFIMNAMGNH